MARRSGFQHRTLQRDDLGKDGGCRYSHGLAERGGRGVAKLSCASLEDANAHDRSADGCLASAGEIAHAWSVHCTASAIFRHRLRTEIRKLRQFSFGWKRHSCGSATGIGVFDVDRSGKSRSTKPTHCTTALRASILVFTRVTANPLHATQLRPRTLKRREEK